MFTFEERLERIPIGDALIARTGHRIDHVDANCDGHEPCYAVVSPNNRIVFLSRNNSRNSRIETIRFVEEFNWLKEGWLPPRDFRAVRGGAADNILWKHPIRSLTIPDANWFFEPSPHTGTFRSCAFLPHERNMLATRANSRLCSQIRLIKTAGNPKIERFYRRGNLYAAKQGSRTLGYLRLNSITPKQASEFELQDFLEGGYSDEESFWKALRYSPLKPDRVLYRLHFIRLFCSIIDVPITRRLKADVEELT